MIGEHLDRWFDERTAQVHESARWATGQIGALQEQATAHDDRLAAIEDLLKRVEGAVAANHEAAQQEFLVVRDEIAKDVQRIEAELEGMSNRLRERDENFTILRADFDRFSADATARIQNSQQTAANLIAQSEGVTVQLSALAREIAARGKD